MPPSSYGTVHGIEEDASALLPREEEEDDDDDESSPPPPRGRRVAVPTRRSSAPPPLLLLAAAAAAIVLLAAARRRLRRRVVVPAPAPPPVPSIGASCAPPVLWSDEFDGADGLDATKWSHQDGDGCDLGLCGWGNSEWEYYTPDNLDVTGGRLIIEARYENASETPRYTSSKILSRGKADFGPVGRFEARMSLPRGQGMWPAFWMLPTYDVYGTWPKSGEIDIMENIGKEGPNTIHGTIHYGEDWPKDQYSEEGIYIDPDAHGDFAESFHTFAVEREPGLIRWFVDDVLYSTKTRTDVAPYRWPFDERYHLLLNLAVGGNWPGYPDNTTRFPQRMVVDYVRVYGGMLPRIDGREVVDFRSESMATYNFVGDGAKNFAWTVPDGAAIVSGQGTSGIDVGFDRIGGGILSVRWDWADGADCDANDGRRSAGIRVKVVDSTKFKDYGFDCGRPSECTAAVLNRDAVGYSCGDRIQWLMDEKGKTEREACVAISYDGFNGQCAPCFPP